MSSLGQAPVIYATAVPVDSSHDMKPENVEKVFNEGGAREFLCGHKWPVGLQDTFIRNLHNISHRFFICDDSGSMSENDGHNVVGGPNEASKRLVSCSRWAELTTSLRFHASLADATCSPTEFRLLNQGNPVLLGTGRHGESANQSKFAALLNGNPTNGTPLCRHIREIVREIQRLEPNLRAQGQRALLVIATDGEASDGDVAQALRPLKNLPVWVMVRLCTDQDRIVDYWNDIDRELELSMDVVDDMVGEAKEIRKFNKWITYGEPLQRLREFGLSVKELDLLDERPLSLEEVRKVCSFIYGGTQDNYPHPQVDFAGFLAAIDRENLKCGAGIWNPVTQTVRPWIDTRALKAAFKTGSCSCIIA